eukprot:m.527646 g.527646  ORF g.527646 m.527646 type:complete len:56 (+) comp22012_c0_seq7:282-449(+)
MATPLHSGVTRVHTFYIRAPYQWRGSSCPTATWPGAGSCLASTSARARSPRATTC